ncbi:transcription factor MYB53-like [Vitis riparia]|uniref:transcription factor MYB53-like n=1 Tax=Vitis riparia TaxID=96939 RepID=UPI00155AC382|nr:transcription factor MYB53-like [Vitis riparia]
MPRDPRRRWTPEEDDKLKHFKTEYPNLPWGDVIKLANLQDRDEKSCWERWNNHLKSDFNKEKFSPQEDERIIYLRRHDVGWASMAENYLRGRAPNAIKNRWNNYLKKRHATTSDPVREDLEARVDEALTTKVDPESPDEETSNHSVASTSDSDDLIPNLHPNALCSIEDTFTI